MTLEKIILSNLVYNEEYGRKVIPFLKSEYFQDYSERIVFEIVDEYVKKYNGFPTKEALEIELTNRDGINESAYKTSKEIIEELSTKEKTSLDWLISNTERFCQDKAIYLGLMKSIKILDEKNGSISKGSIPSILTDALAVSFDTHIGHDLLDDSDELYEFFHRKEKRVSFDLDYFNAITNGGLPNKTLNIALAGTGVGKSLFMCHCASANINNGLNVLYITLEMAEERIAERIYANLLDVAVDELQLLPKQTYDQKVELLKSKVTGKLIIKEYPTACAGSANFRHLLNELKIKKNFVPDIIYIDYINICGSSRIKRGQANSYEYIKAIAEELRGLAVETAVPIVSATQLNRTGFQSSDVGLEDTAESFGLPATADFMCALISTEELEEMNQIMVKQLKNRLASKQTNKRFVIGVDRQKMRFYDVEDQAQEDLIDGPIMDRGKFMEEDTERNKPKPKFDKMRFKGFK